MAKTDGWCSGMGSFAAYLRGLFLALTFALPALALAQAYPSKPIRFIVPFPPGGGTDTISRALTQQIGKAQGWTFAVENRPGAGGNLGADLAAKAPPDGYTLVLGQTSNLSINPSLYARMPFDPVADLAPVSLVASVPLVIVSNGKGAIRSIADLVRLAKASPGKLSFASPGNGTVGHLAGVLLLRNAGLDVLHVPYKGAGPALTDLLGGQVDLYLSTPAAASGHVKSGALHAIAVTSAQRERALPQVPTIAEAGYPAATTQSWYGVLAPARTPAAIIELWNGAIQKALAVPEVREALTREGGEVLGGTPAQFSALIRADQEKWGRVVREAGVKLD